MLTHLLLLKSGVAFQFESPGLLPKAMATMVMSMISIFVFVKMVRAKKAY
jgi:hypothetical protein